VSPSAHPPPPHPPPRILTLPLTQTRARGAAHAPTHESEPPSRPSLCRGPAHARIARTHARAQQRPSTGGGGGGGDGIKTRENACPRAWRRRPPRRRSAGRQDQGRLYRKEVNLEGDAGPPVYYVRQSVKPSAGLSYMLNFMFYTFCYVF
jgi:hypothetical protein